jgi:cytochrome c oxidase assembly protein subunit 15
MQAAPGTRMLGRWLLACAAAVALVLVVGGLTRLQEAGLSIVHWQPVSGVVPPLDPADWEAEFAAYRASPQFRLLNPQMDLEHFRPIYWWEYGHRMAARMAGLAFALPLLYWGLRRHLPRPWWTRLALILALGLLQGLIGWWMVASGLIDAPRVSAVRLALHLGMALALFGLLVWTAWELLQAEPERQEANRDAPLASHAWRVRHAKHVVPALPAIAVGAVFCMCLLGANVAGNRAGLGFASWPLMHGQWIPADLWRLSPWTDNFYLNPVTIQFMHRNFAWVVVALVAAMAWRAARARLAATRRAGLVLASLLAVQFALGVATVLAGVPLALAAGHQLGALVLFAATLRVVWCLRRPVAAVSGAEA